MRGVASSATHCEKTFSTGAVRKDDQYCAQWRNYVRSALRQTFLRRPNIPWAQECHNYNCLSPSSPPPPGTQAIEMTEAKEITYIVTLACPITVA